MHEKIEFHSSHFNLFRLIKSILQRVSFLESENAKLQKSLEHCEEALEIANQETDKANKSSREAQSKIAELESSLQAAGSRAADLEIQLKNAEEKLAEVEEKIRTYQGKLNETKQTNEQVCTSRSLSTGLINSYSISCWHLAVFA